ncbi:MAG: stalk domain-containing protein [Bacillota bacterium]|nr:stalk domain-containing protein [Bacillota bacterium]
MKKFFAGFLCALILMVGIHAASKIEVMLSPEISVKLKGEILELRDVNGKQVYPLLYEGTTYLPVRAISQSLGLFVDYDGPTKTVILDDKPIGKETYFKPGEVWEVPGKWKLTVHYAKFTDQRNKAVQKQPNEVAYISYSYENLSDKEVYLVPEREVKTSDGKTMESYPHHIQDKYGNFVFPTHIRKGEKKEDVTWCFAVDNKEVETVTLTFKQYDEKGKVHSADFVLPINQK